MSKENFLPISIEVCHESLVECLIIEGQMKENFGPWNKSDKVTLTFNFEDGTATEYNDDGDVVDQVKFHLAIA